MARNPVTEPRSHRVLLILLVIALIVGLPIAAWLDLGNLSEAALRRQASDVNSMITSMRDYYASDVVARVLAATGSTQVVHNYESIPGAIPIPAKMSLELGRVRSSRADCSKNLPRPTPQRPNVPGGPASASRSSASSHA